MNIEFRSKNPEALWRATVEGDALPRTIPTVTGYRLEVANWADLVDAIRGVDPTFDNDNAREEIADKFEALKKAALR